MILLPLLSSVALAAWIWLLFGRGRFWRCDQRLGDTQFSGDKWPAVAVIIPARNEQPTIGDAVASALGQDYPGAFRVIVVDDHSEDGTAAEAERAAQGSDRLQVILADPLPHGWTGKLWAQQNGLAYVAADFPDATYYLLTDADIVHPPDLLRSLVAKAVAERYGLVSLMVTLSCATTVERLLVPAFIFFFQKLFPFRWVNNSTHATAAAAGGCMLVDRSVLEATGGVTSIRDHMIDDCALAQQIKTAAPIWLGLSTTSHSLRRYESLGDFWRMVARTAFAQLNYSWPLLWVTVCAMFIVYLVPPLSVVAGLALGAWALTVLGGLSILLMLIAYSPTLRFYGLSRAWGITLPLAAMFYKAMTIDSARLSRLGKGGAWKGRVFSMKTPTPGRE